MIRVPDEPPGTKINDVIQGFQGNLADQDRRIIRNLDHVGGTIPAADREPDGIVDVGVVQSAARPHSSRMSLGKSQIANHVPGQGQHRRAGVNQSVGDRNAANEKMPPTYQEPPPIRFYPQKWLPSPCCYFAI